MTRGPRQWFEELVGLPAHARAARLAELARSDAGLAARVGELLRLDASAGTFLERTPAPPFCAVAGQRLGRFRLVRPLGSGGMGMVWEAEQDEPRRKVAIKLLPPTRRSAADSWRFAHETQVLASLNHPAIATFFEAGSEPSGDAEVAWFAMELVPAARDVLAFVRTAGLSRDQRLQLFLRLCDAVAHGHRHGVVHRDLKPGNVLVGADGTLKLIDFGIARATAANAAEAPHTRTGDLVGTLHWMAPEQLRGDRTIGPSSDVYGLGVLLYHLLTGEAPFALAGQALGEVARIVLETEPIPPRRFAPDLPQDLVWVVLRALAKEPARRYASVDELAADVQRVRAHEPVHARAAGLGYRLRKFVRRRRAAIVVGIAVLGGLLVGGYGLWEGRERALAGERAALRASATSRAVQRTTRGLFDAIDETAASRELTVHEWLDATAIDERATADPAVEQALREVRGSALRRLGRLAEAKRDFERALALQPDVLRSCVTAMEQAEAQAFGMVLQALLGRTLTQLGERDAGERLLGEALAASSGLSYAARLPVLSEWCRFLADENRDGELLPAAAELREVAALAEHTPSGIAAERWTAKAAAALQRGDEAKAAAERAWRQAKDHFGAETRFACEAMAGYVTVLQETKDHAAAEALYPELIELARRVFGPGHDHLLTILGNRVHLLVARGKRAEAIDSMRAIVAAHEAKGRAMDVPHLQAVHNLGMVLNLSGKFAEAEPLLARAASASRQLLAADNPEGAMMRFNHGACLAWSKRFAEAEGVLLAEYERLAALLPAGHGLLAQARRTIADAYATNGRPEQAAAWRAR